MCRRRVVRPPLPATGGAPRGWHTSSREDARTLSARRSWAGRPRGGGRAPPAHALLSGACWLLCFWSAALYSAVLCQIAAAWPFSGLSRFGSPSRLWMERRMVRTLYAAVHFSCERRRRRAGDEEREREGGGRGGSGAPGGGSGRRRGARLQDIEADVAVLVDVRVEARRHEGDLRRLVRVARRELERQLELHVLVHLQERGERG